MEQKIDIGFEIKRIHQTLECEVMSGNSVQNVFVKLPVIDLDSVNYEDAMNLLLDTLNEIKNGD